MKNVKEIKVSSIEELKEVLDGITEDVIAHIEEDKESMQKRVHTPFYITLDDIFEASAKVMAADEDDLDWDDIYLIAKHVSDVAHIIRVHTSFYITLDDIFEASAKVMAADEDDLDWDDIHLIAKHVSDVAHIIEEKFIPVPDEDPEKDEEPKEEKLPGYKRRLKIEYRQLKRRYERLCKMLTKYEANTLEFELNCPIELLKRQKKTMGEYLNCLEIRAEIENVTLEEE